MGRYLCQLCYSIVHYGERHPCFFYNNDDEVYTVPPQNESEEMGGRLEDAEGISSGNSNDEAMDLRVAAEENDIKERKETNSRLIENNERMSQMGVSKRKTNHGSLFSSKFLCGMRNRHLDSTSASLASAQRGGNKAVAEISKDSTKIEGFFAETTKIGDSSSSETFANSAAFGYFCDAVSVSVAGPSGIQTPSHGNEKEKTFVGEVSGKNLPRELHLLEHQKTQTEEKKFVCHKCSRGFTWKGNLMRHFLTHTGEKTFICHVCGKAFSQKQSLALHYRTHTGEKLFACDTCGKKFARKFHLEVHLRTHSGEKPFVCDICSKAFSHKQNLQAHFRIHSGEKPFPCHICSKAFSHKKNLEAHLRNHIEEKPFKCKFCDKYFTTQSNCNRHQKSYHIEMQYF